MRYSIWLILPIFQVFVLGYTGDPIVKDGIGTILGYTGTVYQAVNYIPVCGTLGPPQSLGPSETAPNEITSVCDPAMSQFNKTSSTYAFYDITGILLNVQPALGTAGCMCFSLATISGSAGDFCVSLDGYGQPQIYYQFPGYIVAGDFQPGGKSLPQCKDVNIPAISSSVYATLVPSPVTQTANGVTPAPANTAGSTTPNLNNQQCIISGDHLNVTCDSNKIGVGGKVKVDISLLLLLLSFVSGFLLVSGDNNVCVINGTQQTVSCNNNSVGGSNSTADSGGLSRSDRIALGVGIGFGVPSTIAAILALFWLKRNKPVGNGNFQP
jgi:hypothetical protein